MSDETRFASDGQIWVCGACGKTSKDRYGIEGKHSYGWDESCMLNAYLCDEPTLQATPIQTEAQPMSFCLTPSNADLIADNLVRGLYQAVGELNAPLARLVTGVAEYELNEIRKQELLRLELFLLEAARDVRSILDGQRVGQSPRLLEAAE